MVNGQKVPITMKLNDAGQGYFVDNFTDVSNTSTDGKNKSDNFSDVHSVACCRGISLGLLISISRPGYC